MTTGSLRKRLSFGSLSAQMLANKALEVQPSLGAARKHAITVRRRWFFGVGIAVVAIVLILSLSLTLAGDSSSSSSQEDPTLDTSNSQEKSMSVDQDILAEGVNTFGTALLDRVALENQSASDAVFLSPWGIAHALSMLHEGASQNSEARKQLQQVVFGIQDGAASNMAIRTATKSLSSAIISGSNDINLTVSDANSAWVSPSFQLLDSYVTALKTYYLAEARPLTSAEDVNSWVNEATRGKITNLIDDGTAAAASLILVNAIYFKGLWEAPFNVEETTKQSFYQMQGADATIDVPLMYLQYKLGSAIQAARFKASSDANTNNIDCIAVKVDYKQGGEDYYALLAMPEGAVGSGANGLILEASGVDYASALSSCRASIISSLGSTSSGSTAAAGSSQDVNTVESGTASGGGGGGEGMDAAVGTGGLKWMSPGDPDMATLKIYVPRFEIDYYTSLSPALRSVGLSSIFSPGNFGGISTNGDLAVSDVLHKVYVKVDEQGTEAAAATGIVMVTSMPLEPPKDLIVRFDRPFMFSVVNKKTGLALFVGEVYRPEEWTE